MLRHVKELSGTSWGNVERNARGFLTVADQFAKAETIGIVLLFIIVLGGLGYLGKQLFDLLNTTVGGDKIDTRTTAQQITDASTRFGAGPLSVTPADLQAVAATANAGSSSNNTNESGAETDSIDTINASLASLT